MIQLTRLNGCRLDVNCDLIKYTEASPDTVLTLVTGEKLVVLESSNRALAYRAHILRVAWPDASPALTAKSVFDAHKIALDRSAQQR
jgi:flagellar protein FlbD